MLVVVVEQQSVDLVQLLNVGVSRDFFWLRNWYFLHLNLGLLWFRWSLWNLLLLLFWWSLWSLLLLLFWWLRGLRMWKWFGLWLWLWLGLWLGWLLLRCCKLPWWLSWKLRLLLWRGWFGNCLLLKLRLNLLSLGWSSLLSRLLGRLPSPRLDSLSYRPNLQCLRIVPRHGRLLIMWLCHLVIIFRHLKRNPSLILQWKRLPLTLKWFQWLRYLWQIPFLTK